jgi:N-acyl-D-amino-acid deacylase
VLGEDPADLEADRLGARLMSYWFSKPFDTVTGFRGHLAFDTLPGWKKFRYLPLDEQRAYLEHPERRAELVHEAMTNKSGSELNAEARNPEYDILEVLTGGTGPYQTVEQVAKERGVTPVDAMIDLSLETDFHQLFSQDIFTFKLDQDQYRQWARDPHTVWGVSDAGAHLAQSIGFDLTSFFLAKEVRRNETFSWEEAIRLFTFEPAWAWGFHDRGMIREGLAADLLVLDPDAVDVEAPHIEDDLPGGAIRLIRKGIGYEHTIVNGEETMRDSEPTGSYSGQVLPGSGRPAL